VGPFDGAALVYPWRNPAPAVDRLCEELQGIVVASEKLKRGRTATFEKMWAAVNRATHGDVPGQAPPPLTSRATVPYLNEPWYC